MPLGYSASGQSGGVHAPFVAEDGARVKSEEKLNVYHKSSSYEDMGGMRRSAASGLSLSWPRDRFNLKS